MAFFREIVPARGIRAGIWQIKETSEELITGLLLSDEEVTLCTSMHNDLRKRQWLAYHALLQHLLSPLPSQLYYDAHGKPFLVSGSHYISVSHAGDYAAVVCSETVAVGIDIEKMRDRVERVKERFLQEKELESLAPSNRLEQLYVFWGGKEALYKLHGTPTVDFRNDIHIHPFDYLCNTNQNCNATVTVNECRKTYTIHFQKIDHYMLVVAY